MARRYDSRTTIFSPEGRLYQVEYAMEAISHAGSCIGILAKDGIVIGAERKTISKLLDNVVSAEKIYRLHDRMACAVAGITADANILVNFLRINAQRYLMQNGEEIPCEQMVRMVCDVKQRYTQMGGKRPFGVSMLYMGWDEHHGYQLYQSDPSGNYGGWKATAIGSNNAKAQDILKQDFNEDLTLEDAKKLCVKVFNKTGDFTVKSEPGEENVEMFWLTRVNGEVKIGEVTSQELGEMSRAQIEEDQIH